MVTAEVTMIPQTVVEVTDEEVIKKFTKMLDMFDEDDDVQDVYHNAELPEDEE
jgi:transcriptional/translational regulatory protein YebC/TACO1